MKTPTEQVIERIQKLIVKGEGVLRTHTPNPSNMIGFPTLDDNALSEWRAQSLHMLRTIAGPDSIYTTDFGEKVDKGFRSSANAGIGILKALREDVESGHLSGLISLVRAELFSDMIEMAQHLLDAGYKDPAASLTGAVFEIGLKKIAESQGIQVKPSDDLNAVNQKLVQGSVYSQLQRQQVQIWITIRNRADHGQFNEYEADDVKAMINDVTRFLSNYLD